MHPPIDIAEAVEVSNLIHLPTDAWLENALLDSEEEPKQPETAAGMPRSGFWLCTGDPAGAASITPVSAVWLNGRVLFTAVPEVVGADDPDVFPASVAHLDRHDRDVVVEGTAERIGDGPTLRRFLVAHEEKYGYAPELEEADAAVYAMLPD